MTWRALSTDPSYLKAAFADLGLSEIRGPKHASRVVKLFALAGHSWVKDDETAWCAAAMGGWLVEGGHVGSGSLMARSYAKYGVPCDKKKKLPRGAIIVWPRGKPPSGHVNILLEDDGVFLTCIGANQGNNKGGGVTISRNRKSTAIAARLPIGVLPPKVTLKPKSTPILAKVQDEDAEPFPTLPVLPPKSEPTVEPTVEPVIVEPTAVVPLEAPAVEQIAQIQESAEKDAETRKSWIARKWGVITGWFSGIGGIGVFGYLTDPWVVVAIGGIFILIAILIVLFMGPGKVRAWIRKQVA